MQKESGNARLVCIWKAESKDRRAIKRTTKEEEERDFWQFDVPSTAEGHLKREKGRGRERDRQTEKGEEGRASERGGGRDSEREGRQRQSTRKKLNN